MCKQHQKALQVATVKAVLRGRTFYFFLQQKVTLEFK